MWLLLAFLSAALLGFYDVFKKKSLRDNAVLPVLFLNTLYTKILALILYKYNLFCTYLQKHQFVLTQTLVLM